MALNSPKSGEGFGKRGRVNVSPAPAETTGGPPSTSSTQLKWIGGGLAALGVLLTVLG